MDISSDPSRKMSYRKKRMLEGIFFFLVMGLSFYTIFHGQDRKQIGIALSRLSPLALLLALATALFFVSAEGIIIYYLLRSLHGKSSLSQCISCSFIGFFYCGITPSATGGQPMQLYYLHKDGNRLSEASVVLMTVALIYKLALTLIGVLMLIFWHKPLQYHLQDYFPLYLLGLGLNLALVLLLLAAMLAPAALRAVILRAETLLIAVRILKESPQRQEKITHFVDGYQGSVHFLLANKRKIINVCLFTLLQRCCVFLLPWIIYWGFPLEGADPITVSLLQASVYIAVDMLPLPGSQGVSEIFYRHVFGRIFTDGYLMPSLYVTRGISFYFLMLVSMAAVIKKMLAAPRRQGAFFH